MQDTVGTKPSKWCGGCHDPAVLYSGLMDTPIRKIVHRPEAQAGLGASAQRIEFRDVTADAGIRCAHNNGAFGKKWLPETMGPGCAFIHYDRYPDIVLINGNDFPGFPHRLSFGQGFIEWSLALKK